MDLSIIIISWNVADDLQACLESIYQTSAKSLEVEVIVVDSASSDHTVEMTQTQFPQVNLIVQNENAGFTRGNNMGLKAAQGRHLFLLNPDTLVLGNALEVMVNYLDQHPDVGIVGPYTFNTDGTTQSTRRRFPTVALAFFESTWLQSFAPQALLDEYYVNDKPLLSTVDVDWVQGSALILRREVYEQIGGLDTDYVMFSEELDFCKRAKLMGWRVVFLCTAQIIHHGGKSTQQVVANKHIYFQESKLRYFNTYHGTRVAFILRLFLLMNYVWQIVLETSKSLLGSQPAMRWARIKAYVQVLRSGFRVS